MVIISRNPLCDIANGLLLPYHILSRKGNNNCKSSMLRKTLHARYFAFMSEVTVSRSSLETARLFQGHVKAHFLGNNRVVLTRTLKRSLRVVNNCKDLRIIK